MPVLGPRIKTVSKTSMVTAFVKSAIWSGSQKSSNKHTSKCTAQHRVWASPPRQRTHGLFLILELCARVSPRPGIGDFFLKSCVISSSKSLMSIDENPDSSASCPQPFPKDLPLSITPSLCTHDPVM